MTAHLQLSKPDLDADLLDRLRRGDPDALADCFERYASAAFTTAYRISSSFADAEDVTQDLFVALPEQARGYSGRGSFEGWIRRVAARLALSQLRRRARRRETALDPEVLSASTACTDRMLHDTDLERALAQLPESLRTVFVLREVEGFTHAEIAELLGIRSGTSEVRLNRARQKLRKVLER